MIIKKNVLLLLIICLTFPVMPGCSADNVDDATDARSVMPAVTNMAGSKTSAEVCDDLNTAGLSNVVTFNDWVLDFAGSAGDGAGLSDKWTQPEQILRILQRVQMAGKSNMTILMLTAGLLQCCFLTGS